MRYNEGVLQEKINQIEGDVAEIRQDISEIKSNLSVMKEAQEKLYAKHERQLGETGGLYRTLDKRLWTGLFVLAVASIGLIIKFLLVKN